MKLRYNFKFDLKQPVVCLDYSENEWRGVVLSRCLKEDEDGFLTERYEVLVWLGEKHQICEFKDDRLRKQEEGICKEERGNNET